MSTPEQIIKTATESPIAAAAIYSKDELYSAMDSIGRKIQRAGESIHQARVRAGTTPEGLALMRAYAEAPKVATPVEKVTRQPVEEFRKAMPGGDSVAQIDAIAQKIAKDEKISLPVARARAWDRNPKLLAMYNAAKAQTTHGQIGGGRR